MTPSEQQLNHPPGELVGVLGGMGPLATAAFYQQLIQACQSDRDQDHVPVLIWGDPTTPDRSEAFLARGEDPTPHLRHAAQVLKDAGATVIVVPCNTAHLFIHAAIEGLDLRLISMIDETVSRLLALADAPSRVGLLATTGTIESALYQRALAKVGIETVIPTAQDQSEVMQAIRAVKSGDLRAGAQGLEHAAELLAEQGVDQIIAGCTEVPLALGSRVATATILDPTQFVIDRIVHEHRSRRISA